MDAYELHEARFVQHFASTSAANAESISTPTCPDGKVQTILTAGYFPSVAENMVVQWQIYKPGVVLPLTPPYGWDYKALNTNWPCVTEGMEVKLYPGESLMIVRDGHTAASTMTIRVRFIESDLPYYSYEEPQNKVVRSVQRHGSVYRSSGAISPARSGLGSPGPVDRGGGGGGGGKAQPV